MSPEARWENLEAGSCVGLQRSPLGASVLLLPIGHDSLSVRRLPFVTLSIAALCLVVQVYAWTVEVSIYSQMEGVAEEFQVLFERFAAECEVNAGCEVGADPFESLRVAASRGQIGDETSRSRFLTLVEQLQAAMEAHPVQRFGFMPAEPSLLTLLASLFVHGGFWHLFGNMLFLYVVGLSLEDRWGRGRFLGLYLVGGLVATISYALLHRNSSMPLVGASGAISCAMGAFALLF